MAVRIRSRFHAAGRPRSMAEVASVVAMLAWKLAMASIERMRSAGFDIDLGRPYFDFVCETMAFLAHYADRIAFERLPPEGRAEFTTALARRLAEIVEDNADMLLRASAPGRGRQHFLEVFNAAGADYAEHACDAQGPDFGFRRAYAARVRAGMPEKDHTWVYDQIMEIEAPEGAQAVRRTLEGLLGSGGPPGRARETLTGP